MIPNLPFAEYNRVVCIPTYEEFHFVPDVLAQLADLDATPLVILNNNCREDSPESVIQDNLRLQDWLLSHPHHNDGTTNLIDYNGLAILLLDHSTNGCRLQSHEGVGLARHQCSEMAIKLMDQGIISCPWMWCTDGDVSIPHNYLTLPPIKEGTQIMGYWHDPAPPELMLYEMGLRYYTLGLHYANSPIAFPTIGSCIVIHAKTYQQIYGFPDRQAAEDFYLLNKAVKVAPVHYNRDVTLTIRGRPSERVPFGTGRGMQEILDQDLDYHLYHPEIFNILKTWIQVLNTSSDDTLIEDLTAIVPDYPYFNKIRKVIKQRCPERQRIQRRHTFFDHFQTMRFVHHLRDTHWTSIPWKQAIAMAPFIPLQNADILSNREYLRTLENENRGHSYPRY
jgi:hypothetical protein